MPDTSPSENSFMDQLNVTIDKNIANERFGVSELADEMNMSRSNLLRRVKKETNLPVNQLIREARLNRGMALLKTGTHNVSEVAHDVGFSSTSYFIKCFREHFGYPPGEVGKAGSELETNLPEEAVLETSRVATPRSRRPVFLLAAFIAIAVTAAGLFVYYRPLAQPETFREKSIVVLPFKNDSNDSSNVYLINGLMESTLNNLQQIKDLKVISRTSAEKYRNTRKSIPEMARELNVNYFVAGSGQKIGDQIVLNIQLIDAATDRHLWSQQYRRQVGDIFALQQQIARSIVEEIQVIITPEEAKRIDKIPTKDLEAYDLFLKGRELARKGDTKNLEAGIVYYKQALERDKEFALAYAEATIAYYYIDAFQANPQYTAEIGDYSDKALLYDSRLAESLMAKALYYMNRKEADQAVPYLEKALQYNPNAIVVINFLADFYCNYVPNTSKYLEYALRGVKLDAAVQDSTATSYNYLRLSNALVQAGFIKEALTYVNRAIDYDVNNAFAGYLKAYILLARDNDATQTKRLLLRELRKDTTRLDVLQEVGKIYCLMRQYDSAYVYYNRFAELQQSRQLDMFRHEAMHMAVVMERTGHPQEAKALWSTYKAFADSDRSIYKNMALSGYYAHQGDLPKALHYLELFTKENDFQYWILLAKVDPVMDPLHGKPEFKKLMAKIEKTFWDKHNELRITLQEKGLL